MKNIILLLAILTGMNAEARVAYDAYRMPSSGNLPGWGKIDVANGVTGVLPAANGGTGGGGASNGGGGDQNGNGSGGAAEVNSFYGTRGGKGGGGGKWGKPGGTGSASATHSGGSGGAGGDAIQLNTHAVTFLGGNNSTQVAGTVS